MSMCYFYFLNTPLWRLVCLSSAPWHSQMICQCSEQGCIYDALLRFGRWKTVISRSCSTYFLKSSIPCISFVQCHFNKTFGSPDSLPKRCVSKANPTIRAGCGIRLYRFLVVAVSFILLRAASSLLRPLQRHVHIEPTPTSLISTSSTRRVSLTSAILMLYLPRSLPTRVVRRCGLSDPALSISVHTFQAPNFNYQLCLPSSCSIPERDPRWLRLTSQGCWSRQLFRTLF